MAAYNGVNYSSLTKCKWACILQVVHLRRMQMGIYVASQDGWMQMGNVCCEQSRKDERKQTRMYVYEQWMSSM